MPNPKKFFKTKKIFLLYFISYLTVIIIPILFIGIFAYYLFFQTVEEEISKANNNSLKQISKVLNDVLYDVNDISVQIGLNGKLYTYSKNTTNHFLLNNIKDEIKTIAGSNQNIHSIQIYFKEDNKILSSEGITHKYIEDQGDLWVEQMKSSTEDAIWVGNRNVINLDGKTEQIVTLVRKLPIAFSEKTGFVAVNLNKSKLAELMKEMEHNERANIYIASEEGEIISSFIQNELAGITHHLNKIEESGEQGYFIDRAREPSTLVSYVKGLSNNWMLVSETSLDYLMERSAYIRNITILICGILMVIGIIISYFLSRSMYNPIRKLIEKSKHYKEELSLQIADDTNDFNFLSVVMDKAVIKNKSLESEIRASAPALKNKFIFNLLYNQMSSTREIYKQMDSLPIQLTKENYIAIILDLDNYVYLQDNNSMTEISMYRFAISNIAEEIIGTRYPCMCTDINGKKIVIVVNIGERVTDWKGNIRELIEKIQKSVKQILDVSFSFSVGGLYKDISQVFMSYNEAMNSNKNKIVLGNNAIIFFDDYQDNEIINYIYPLRLERNFMNYLKIGDEDKIISLIDDIKKEIKNGQNLSNENIYRLYSRLLDAAIQVLLDHNGSVSKVFGERYMIYQELAKRETVDDIHEWMTSILVVISKFIAEERNETQKTKVEIVLEYMNNHYMEDLSVDEIANIVNLNPAYLSRIFKQTVGKTIVEYLTEIRLERSIELLKNSSLTIKEIAEAIGYNNVNSYIRFFKKYEGLTPGEYRRKRLTS